MHKVMILGAGKIGSTIARFLHDTGHYQVCVGDNDERALARLKHHVAVETRLLPVQHERQLGRELAGWERVISACYHDVNPIIARAALRAGISYFDLTEDRATTRAIQAIAQEAGEGQVFMPQCGLAPGFVCILAYDLCQRFERLDSVKMRVGALPKFPSNQIKYNLTWSTDGLINEYCNPCDAIAEGHRIDLMPLEGLEYFSLEGVEYEAFNTSGGLGTLCDTLEGRVQELTYKTVRYPGHQHLMRFLLHDLKMGQIDRRDQLRELLESAIPITLQDVVLVFVTVTGQREGLLTQESDVRKLYHRQLNGEHYSSIQLTTAAGICAAVELHATQKLPTRGYVKQEQVRLEQLLATSFGFFFSDGARHLSHPQPL